MYQSWFQDLLNEALIPPETQDSASIPKSDLPFGGNSFFRQLDHMIATLCNEEFRQLYQISGEQLDGGSNPSQELIGNYSNRKAAIFSRYRTLSELLGVLLLREAQKVRNNCLMETSGRDLAMFHYIGKEIFLVQNFTTRWQLLDIQLILYFSCWSCIHF